MLLHPFELLSGSERTMDLSVHLDNSVQSGLLWCSTSGIQLGRLASGSSTLLKLALIPTASGLLVSILLQLKTSLHLHNVFVLDHFWVAAD
jgi:hypothetical protein